MQGDAIPQILKEKVRFCCWKYEIVKDRQTKVPYNPVSKRRAKTDNPETFSDFASALATVDDFDGLGFLVGNKICALDLDDCFADDDSLNSLARVVVEVFIGSYMERSPSGKGLRIIFMSDGFVYDKARYYINNQKIGLEVYVAGVTNRFVTVTGNVFKAGDVFDQTDALQIVLDKYMLRPVAAKPRENNPAFRSYLSDESVIEKALNAINGEKFSDLWAGKITQYASESEADLALSSLLAFWCGCDLEQMDRLFRKSGMMREKWDRQQSGTTYGQITLQKAVSGTSKTYSPIGKKSMAATAPEAGSQNLEKMRPHDNPRYSWSDIGNGNLFADYYQCIARYVIERKLWYVYTGAVWEPDVGNLKTMEFCKQLADNLMIYSLSITDEKTRGLYIKFIQNWQGRRYREIILKDATGVHPVSISEFDCDPYQFNCQNGTVDLKTAEFHNHRPEDMLSKVSGVKYEPTAWCDRWERFIHEVMQGDCEKATFLRKALGYALTGDSRYEALFLLYGPTTRNGKGTCMETFMRIMGDYGKTARPETIGMKINGNSGNPTEDIARLVGARFVNISEPDKRLVLSTALVKTLTGNDTINARFLHENSFDYRPQFKLFINTNHLPQVNDLTLFTSGRVKIIPFERHFEEHEQDHRLKGILSKPKNLSGILNWCITGYLLMEREGLEMPDSVRIATDQYKHNSDKIALFMEEAMIKVPHSEVRTSKVYSAYKLWCYENGYKSESSRNFNAALAAIVEIERRRPITGGEKTTMISGYQLVSDREFLT